MRRQGEQSEQGVGVRLVRLLLALLVGAPLAAQSADPRPNECWGFAFATWSPALDWAAAGHGQHSPRVSPPPTPEASSTGGAPRHDAASFEWSGQPTLVLYPTWWPVGVGIALERQPMVGDTVAGAATAYIADGRRTPPTSRIRAWRTPCGEPPARSATRAVPDERR